MKKFILLLKNDKSSSSKRILYILLLYFGFLTNFVLAQSEIKTPYFVQLSHIRGENKPHRPVIANLTYPYRGAEIKIGWQSIGKQPWQVAFRYPSYGLGFNYSTFETEVLGVPASLFFFTTFPQINSKLININLDVNFGLSYGINPYNKISNPQNFSTGSSINAFFGIYLEQSIHIDKKFDIVVSEGLTHYSNGAMGYPNLGLNVFPTLKIGFRDHQFDRVKLNKDLQPQYKRNWQFSLYIGGGVKTLFAAKPLYRELVLQPSIYYRPSYKRRIGLSYDIIYNEAITGIWTRSDESGRELITQSVLLSHEFLIKRFTILTQIGMYVVNLPFDKVAYSRYDIDSIVSRLGIGFHLSPWAKIVLNLKSHYIKAEYIETGLVFNLNVN